MCMYVCMYISYTTLEGTKCWDTVQMLRETHYFIVQLGSSMRHFGWPYIWQNVFKSLEK